MLASDLLRAALVSLIALLAVEQWLALWQIFIVSALFGVVEAFFYPAYAAVIPEIMPTEFLPSANALRSVSGQVALLAGPAIAATIIALSGVTLAFALDGLSFFISATCLLAVPKASKPDIPGEVDAGVLHDVRQGIGIVLHTPWLWITLAVACASTLFLVGPAEAALPLLVKQRFGEQVGLYALLTALAALGSLGAALWMGRFKRLRRRGLLIYGAWLIAGLMLLAIGLPLPAVGVSIAFFVQGAAFEVLGLAWINTLQEFIPGDLLGRVSSVDALVSSGLLPIGYGLAGIAADHLGASLVFVLGGAISAALIALGLLHPAIRALD
jgi:DHA3 family tetracycline resistance protein-like MFS transporter